MVRPLTAAVGERGGDQVSSTRTHHVEGAYRCLSKVDALSTEPQAWRSSLLALTQALEAEGAMECTHVSGQNEHSPWVSP